MTAALALSLGINIVVGAYLVWIYPKSVQKNFARGRTPPAFAWLAKALPIFGAALMASSAVYGLLALGGLLGS